MSRNTLKRLFLILVGTVCLTASPRLTAANEELTKLLGDYWEDYLRLHPIAATYAGDHRYDDRLPNILSPDHRAAVQAFYQRYLKAAQEIETTSLTAEEKLSVELLNWECSVNARQGEFPTHLLPLNQFESLHLTVGQLGSGSGAHPFKTVTDYENWLKRLNEFYPWCHSAITYMKEGISKGYVLPQSLIKKVIPQINDLATRPIADHLFWQPIKNLPASFSTADRQRLTASYRELLDQRVIPAFEALGRYLQSEYLSAGRSTSGIASIPNGNEYYQHQIKIYTTTELSPEQIFEIGQSEVARLTAEMEKVKAQLGFKGSLKEFFQHVRTTPKLSPYQDPQQVIDHFNAIHTKMKPHVARLFRLTPKTAFEVRRTEAFREASSSAEYHPGSMDGTRPGIFYVPIPKVEEYNILSDEDLFLHEAIPGHHYQISLQQENEALPKFRRALFYSSYGEGWALYCESLGKELGLYEDPYQYFGMLSAEMHRAIRLVVDVGMHHKGWTREQAIQYSLDHEAEPEAGIISEIERYMSWPGQALSYKIGQIQIRKLRDEAENALGDQFDIRTFHDKVLESGCLPLTVLEKKIQDWISEQK